MTRFRISILAAVILGVGFSSCSKDTAAPLASVSLEASPAQLSLTDSTTTASVYLTASASGGRLDWQLANAPNWVTVTPTEGTIRDDVVELSVSAPGLAGMEPGVLQGGLSFVSNGGSAEVAVTAHISADPVPSFSDTLLSVPATSDTGTITLANVGRGVLSWSVSTSLGALYVSPSNGTLSTGGQVELTVVADKKPLPVGTTRAELTIQSNSRHGDVTLPVSIDVPSTPQADVRLARLVFLSGVTQRQFFLYNTGKGPLNWSAAADMPWLALSPASGQVAPGDSVAMVATVDSAIAAAGRDTAATITVTSDGTVPEIALPVLVAASGRFPLGLTVLDHRVMDAEYSASAGLIVTVSTNPSQLNILDTETGRVAHVALDLPPTCVSVQPDGAYAAVGHDGYISYVDLMGQKLVRTYAVTTDVLDVVLAGNGWVYAMPRRDQWESIRSIDLATGQEQQTFGIYAGALARLHPSGNYLYVATNGLSPDNVDKYDIRDGVATSLWGSPYWGDYPFGGLVWFSEDGTRMFARSGNVYRASDAQSEDMYYAGSLAGSGIVSWAADSGTNGRVYIVSSGSPTGLRVYDSAYLAYQGTVQLPTFETPSGPVSSTGYYVFPSQSGDRIYVLAQADPAAGLANDWGLAVLDAATMP